MRINLYIPIVFGSLVMLSVFLGKNAQSQERDSINTINLPLPHENLSIFDFALVRLEYDKAENPPADITTRNFVPAKEIFPTNDLRFADSVTSFWIKLQLNNNQSSDTTIALKFPPVSKAVLYKAQGDRLILIGKTGFFIAKSKRQLSYEHARIDMFLKAHSKTDFFLQVILVNGIWLPQMPVLQSFAYAEMQAFDYERKTVYGNMLWNHVFTGVFLMFFLFGLIKFLVLGKDKVYLYYGLLGLFSALMAVAQSEYPPLEFPWFENLRGIELFDLLSAISYVMQGLFILEILQLKNKYPRITLLAEVLIFSWLFFATIHTIQFAISKKPAPVMWMIKVAYSYLYFFLLLSWVIYLSRIRKGFYRFIFLGALTIFISYFISLVITYFNLFYLLPTWFGPDQRGSLNHFMQIALLIDLLFYFTGLAQRDRQVEKDKIIFQGQLIQQLQANKEIQEKFTSELEHQVKERTAEVVKEKAEVESTLLELKSAQAQLIQSEKMASLGELTAGIAHEIQNPLNFVNNFSEINTELIEELKNEKLKNSNERNELLEGELLSDIADNEQKINHHGKRADAIVKGMLQHSRMASGQKELTDVNALTDEYLRLSYHGLRAKDTSFAAVLKTHFDESIEKINIIPQDIGRVILNLFTNAFYTVTKKKQLQQEGFEPEVSVSTKRLNNKVEIRVKDNGMGISNKIIGKIFQPFYTTKPTGEGTGLGLSLSYDIMKAHGGEISVESKENEGTVFCLSLPL